MSASNDRAMTPPSPTPVPVVPLEYQRDTAPAPPTPRDATSALLAGFLGWTLDAFDFFLVVMSLPHIAADFHASVAAVTSSIMLTLAFRPVGAFIFGLLADRYGRRLPLMIDLVFYSVVEVATGLRAQPHDVPDPARAVRHRHGRRVGRRRVAGDGEGAAAVARRALGLAAGGLRGRLPAGGRRLRLFCSHRWGWRPLFFLGGLPALLALFVRFGVKRIGGLGEDQGRELVATWAAASSRTGSCGST